jgi:hypothetical protein
MKFTFKPFKGDTKSPEAGGMLDFALKNHGLSVAPLTPMSEESSDNPRAKRKEQIRRAQKYV